MAVLYMLKIARLPVEKLSKFMSKVRAKISVYFQCFFFVGVNIGMYVYCSTLLLFVYDTYLCMMKYVYATFFFHNWVHAIQCNRVCHLILFTIAFLMCQVLFKELGI